MFISYNVFYKHESTILVTMNRIIIIFISLLILLLPNLRAGESQSESQNAIEFERLTVKDGLFQSSVYSIIQDKKGFMWFATVNGLNKYDGYNITRYSHYSSNPKSLNSKYVNVIREDPSSVLWVGTGAGLDRFDPETESFTHYTHAINSID